MKIRLWRTQDSYFAVTYRNRYDFILLPSIAKPKFVNVKKERGEEWRKEDHLKWYISVYARWLVLRFEIKITG